MVRLFRFFSGLLLACSHPCRWRGQDLLWWSTAAGSGPLASALPGEASDVDTGQPSQSMGLARKAQCLHPAAALTRALILPPWPSPLCCAGWGPQMQASSKTEAMVWARWCYAIEGAAGRGAAHRLKWGLSHLRSLSSLQRMEHLSSSCEEAPEFLSSGSNHGHTVIRKVFCFLTFILLCETSVFFFINFDTIIWLTLILNMILTLT